jgi:hypothetical protein
MLVVHAEGSNPLSGGVVSTASPGSDRPIHVGPEIPITVSLGAIAGTLIVTTVASLVQDRLTRRSAEPAEPVDSVA